MPAAVIAATVAAVSAGSTFTVAAGLTLGFSWTAFAGALVMGVASSALQGKPKGGGGDLPPTPERQLQDRTITIQEPIPTGKLHFGRLRLGGARTLVEKTGGNSGSLHMLITLSANPLKGLDEIWFNDEVVPLDGSGNATGKYAGYAKVIFGDGTPSGDAALNAALKAALPDKWTDDHKQTGCAKIYVRLEWSNDLYGGAMPNITAICRCETSITDPRDASVGWTDNAALALARYLTTAANNGGFGSGWGEIDTTELSAAANICDEMVSLRAKSTTFTAVAATDLLTLADGNMNLLTGSRVRLTTSGALPGGLSTATDYYWINVGALTGKLATSADNAKAGTAIDITSAGTGTQTIQISTAFTADAATDRITLADSAGRLRTGMRVRLTTDGTLPGGLATGTDYYFCETGTLKGGLATSLANARARTLIDITSAGTGTHQIIANAEPRYTANGTVDSKDTPETIINNFLSAMGGRLIRANGKWIVRAGAWIASSKTIGQDDLADSFKVQWRREPRDLYNGVKGTFTDPDSSWQATDFPSVAPAAYLSEDQGIRAWTSLPLPFTTSASMAQRLARIELERNRRQIATTLALKLSCLGILGGDTVAFDWSRYGWSGKTFEVTRFKLNTRTTDDGQAIVCEGDFAEIDANVFAWTPTTDEAYMTPSPRTNLPSASTVQPPTSMALSSGTAELDKRIDGTVFSRLKVSWTAPADAYVTSGGLIEVQYKKSADVAWQPSEFTLGSATFYRILDVQDGVAYDVQIRARNYLGATSAWVTVTGHVVQGKTQPPSNVSGFSAAANGTAVVLKWSPVSDADLDGYDIRYSPQSVSSWSAATPLSQSTGATTITTISVPPGDWTFYIKARDNSGNLSTVATTANASIGLIPVGSTNIIVYSAPQAPDWLGTKTNCHVHYTGVLVPDSTVLAKDMTDAELWDQFNAYPVATAVYEAPEIDLAYDSRVRSYAATGARLGAGETAGAAICQLEQDYKLSAGSYDGFESWSIGTNDFRYAKQRITLAAADAKQVATTFTPTIDAAIRTDESGTNVAVASGGTAVTFNRRFFTVPNVQVTPVGGVAKQAWAESITTTGFTLKTADGVGAAIAGNVNWQATGV